MAFMVSLVEVMLLVIFAIAGLTKLGGYVWQRRQFAEVYQLPTWVRYASGTEEVIGAALLMAALAYPPLGLAAGLWAAMILTGWMMTHSRVQGALASPDRARILLMLALATLTLQTLMFLV